MTKPNYYLIYLRIKYYAKSLIVRLIIICLALLYIRTKDGLVIQQIQLMVVVLIVSLNVIGGSWLAISLVFWGRLRLIGQSELARDMRYVGLSKEGSELLAIEVDCPDLVFVYPICIG